jgi:class II lanthipeptide synthase
MTEHERAVRSALAATEILSEGGYSWLGRGLDVPVAYGPARENLLRALASRLYADFYCRGGPTPADDSPRHHGHGGPFAEALSAANRGGGSWESGWTALGVDDGRLVVTRSDVRLWASHEDVASPTGDPVVPGGPVLVRLPKELRRLVPGFYTALGDRGLESGAVFRLYWNLGSAAAVPFVEEATTRLNAAGIPFRLKVVDAPERFTRCDAGVLYLARADADRAAPHVAALHALLASALRPGTPVFTRRLAPGLAVADEPRDGDSFGAHRCRVLADGIIRAHERGERTLEGRSRVVAERFAEAGISMGAPHLEPGSVDVAIPLG